MIEEKAPPLPVQTDMFGSLANGTSLVESYTNRLTNGSGRRNPSLTNGSGRTQVSQTEVTNCEVSHKRTRYSSLMDSDSIVPFSLLGSARETLTVTSVIS